MTAFAPTFLDLQQRVIFNLKLDYGNGDHLDAVRNALNGAQNRVAAETRWFTASSTLTALAAAATTAAIPAAIVELDYIACTYAGLAPVLQEVPFEQLLVARSTGAVAGPPQLYAVRKDTLELWPNAAGGELLTLYGASLPDLLAAGTDVSALPEPYGSNLLVYAACVELADAVKDPLLPQFLGQYQAWQARFIAYISRRAGNGAHRFRVRGPASGGVFANPSTDVPWR